jgi:hypothetical protein
VDEFGERLARRGVPLPELAASVSAAGNAVAGPEEFGWPH